MGALSVPSAVPEDARLRLVRSGWHAPGSAGRMLSMRKPYQAQPSPGPAGRPRRRHPCSAVAVVAGLRAVDRFGRIGPVRRLCRVRSLHRLDRQRSVGRLHRFQPVAAVLRLVAEHRIGAVRPVDVVGAVLAFLAQFPVLRGQAGRRSTGGRGRGGGSGGAARAHYSARAPGLATRRVASRRDARLCCSCAQAFSQCRQRRPWAVRRAPGAPRLRRRPPVEDRQDGGRGTCRPGIARLSEEVGHDQGH